MESVQKELIGVLLDHIRTLGLISDAAYSGAMDLVHSAMDFPEFFRCPVCAVKEVEALEHTQDAE